MDESQKKDEERAKNGAQTPPSFPVVVPPPPPEVKVRTLRSDIESMVKSGGSAPQFRSVKAPGLAAIALDTASKPKLEAKQKNFLWAIVAVLVLLIGAVSYLAYQVFFKNPPAWFSNIFGISEEQGTSSYTTAQNNQPLVIPDFKHKSFLRKDIEETFKLVVGEQAESAAELQTYGPKVAGILAHASATSTFFEIVAENKGGKPIAASEFFPLIGADILNSQFVFANFNPDFTIFVYKDKNGSWPGYILGLKPGQNWLFLKSDIAQLENSAKIVNLFLTSPGDPSKEGFRETVVGGQPARILNFSSGASFVYGWFRGYLILSTSEDGLKEALARL